MYFDTTLGRAHDYTKHNFNYPCYDLQMSSRALIFHGHGPWPQCTVALTTFTAGPKVNADTLQQVSRSTSNAELLSLSTMMNKGRRVNGRMSLG